MTKYEKIKGLLSRVTLSCLDKQFDILLEYDKKYTFHSPLLFTVDEEGNKKDIEPVGRLYLQLKYDTACTKDGHFDTWKGRKWYLSDHQTDDEIVKTCYLALDIAVRHELLEGFKVDGRIPFNPHCSFSDLLKVSSVETKRS